MVLGVEHVQKVRAARFTKNPQIPIAKSIVDYIFRWMELTFPNGCWVSHTSATASAVPAAVASAPATSVPADKDQRVDDQFRHFMEDAPACDRCGSITVRNGACYRCYNCGNSMGCS